MNNFRFLLPLLLFLLLSRQVHSQDTLRNTSGSTEVGKLDKEGERSGWWSTYSSDGMLLRKTLYKAGGERQKQNIVYEYSNRNRLKATGRFKSYMGKHGKWQVYDDSGALVKVAKYKAGDLHGPTRLVQENKIVRYYFGHTKEELYNPKGQRYVFYFTYGMPASQDRSEEEEKFACKTNPIAGCLVPGQVRLRASVHNFFVDKKQILRFGFGWKRRFFN